MKKFFVSAASVFAVAMMLNGCSKCSQNPPPVEPPQPTVDAPPVVAPSETPPADGAAAPAPAEPTPAPTESH